METKGREVCVSKQDQEGQIGKKVKTKQKLMSKDGPSVSTNMFWIQMIGA